MYNQSSPQGKSYSIPKYNNHRQAEHNLQQQLNHQENPSTFPQDGNVVHQHHNVEGAGELVSPKLHAQTITPSFAGR